MDKVYLYKCTDYSEKAMDTLAASIFATYGPLFADKKVVVKPNLVAKKGIDTGATTHPAMLRAVCKQLLKAGAEVCVAESHGGTYTDSSLKSQFAACGVTEALADLPVKLFNMADTAVLEQKDGLYAKSFEVIRPIVDCDLIVNLCKIKTHALTMYSGALKNTFGVVPGLRKFELHARFPNCADFVGMLNDLHTALPVALNIADGIRGMEGNGPTAGIPRDFGFVAVSASAFMADLVAADLLGLVADRVPQLADGIKRGLGPSAAHYSQTNLTEEEYEALRVKALVLPDSHPTGSVSMIARLQRLGGGRVIKLFKPRPKINKKQCAACGKCAQYCPVKTIEMKKGRPKIHRDKCISCFCCQELCPFKAIYIKTNRILKI